MKEKRKYTRRSAPNGRVGTQQLADRLGVARQTIQEMIAAGTLPEPVRMTGNPRGRKTWGEKTINDWFENTYCV